jgi:hypothetical protein
MKIINKNGFTKSEVERYRRILRDNSLRSIQVLIEMAEKKEFKIPKKLQVCIMTMSTVPLSHFKAHTGLFFLFRRGVWFLDPF